VSPAIWVKFPISGSDASVVIWTTTPWTIPGSRAISFSPDIQYGVYEVTALESDLKFEPWVRVGEKLALADKLAEDVLKTAKAASWQRVSDFDPLNLFCKHPLHSRGYDFEVPLLAGDHVTDDAGTGFVHTAPGHGADDFAVWLASGHSQKDIPYTVDEDGRLTNEAPGFEGLEILQLEGKQLGKDGPANEAVIKALIEAGALLARGRITHSYPHSWRSHAPLIFRATPQWFVALDTPYAHGPSLREVALKEIDRVDWGQHRLGDERDKNRIRSMMETRPDWLVSRQRAWGVPLAMFVHRETGTILQDDEVDQRIIAAMQKGGADVWWSTPAQEFLGNAHKAEDYEKVEDILDVWFDSGSTHAFVVDQRWPTGEHRPPVVYLEGADQHRGWFHSSLLESCITRGRAPYDAVITYQFCVDEQGRKMSKSLGNGVEPQDVQKQYGIEIFRLLVAAADYHDELRVGKTIIEQSSETYRKLRNTLRYLLGALKGFTEAEGLSPSPQGGGETPLLERWLMHRLWEVDRDVRAGYETYEFHRALAAIVEFCNVDLSAFYVDVRKDALYCDPPSSLKRRACRTALDATFRRLATWLAPLMPFTTDEAWLARYPEALSVHVETLPETPAAWRGDAAADAIAKLRRVRGAVTGALEVARREKTIGAALEAHPDVFVPDGKLRALIASVDFAELCITSGVAIIDGEGPPDAFRAADAAGVAVHVRRATGVKCARSWKYFDPATADPAFPDITARDAQAVREWEAARA
jgi:isoleucyl-tRNA synthetase